MRILFVCNEYPPAPHGGIGTFVQTLGQRLSQHGFMVYVIGYDPQSISTHWEADGLVSVLSMTKPTSKYLGFSLGRYELSTGFLLERKNLSIQIESVIKENKIDVVESYDWSGPLWNKPSVPLIVRMHGANTANCLAERKHPSRILRWIEKRNVKMADHLIAVSNHIGEATLTALNIKLRRYLTIYNGVDTNIFRPLNQVRDPKQILFVGSLQPRKGIYELFKAFAIITENEPLAHLKIVGRLPEGSKGTKLKAELLDFLPKMAAEKVEFTGHLPHSKIPEIYNQAEIAVFPSHTEAFGLTCAEAMACGTSVVMTRRGSGPEIVEDGVSGILIDPTSPKALAEVILKVLENPDLRHHLGEHGRERVNRYFDGERIVEQNIILYESLVGEK